MRNQKIKVSLFGLLLLTALTTIAAAQTSGLLKRTNLKTESVDFGSGGTVTVTGAPVGSITITGWQNNKIEISAEIEVQGASETDLALLSSVGGYAVDTNMGHTTITSVPPDKRSLKVKDKKSLKALLAMPFKIDYVIKVPRFADLEINGGEGDLSVSGVDGVMQIKFIKTNARLDLVGGMINATFGNGTVDVMIPDRSWRGRSAEIQLANGTMNVQLPLNLNAEVDGTILRTGKIDSTYGAFKPREREIPFTEKAIVAKAGTGGIGLKFTVGDGTLNFMETKK
jgi:hypothetical protein